VRKNTEGKSFSPEKGTSTPPNSRQATSKKGRATVMCGAETGKRGGGQEKLRGNNGLRHLKTAARERVRQTCTCGTIGRQVND